MPRRLRYQVAASLDGFIARENGDFDWIIGDPAIDFAALHAEFDTLVMGRKTFQIGEGQGGGSPGKETIVFSRTLPARESKGVRVTAEGPATVVRALKEKQGRDIWLYGGGALFRTLLDAGLVDSVEVAVIPVLLGSGIPLLPPGGSAKLALADHRVLPRSGIVILAYAVAGSKAEKPSIRFVKGTSPRKEKKKTGPGR
ncbi:MAG TPA: dihydrofolate reductase family protein [Gemmatimonadaceae bacterium]|nr:dihydrofolate reductase family protein [Gemmatimonadaceae bacterium]